MEESSPSSQGQLTDLEALFQLSYGMCLLSPRQARQNAPNSGNLYKDLTLTDFSTTAPCGCFYTEKPHF